MGDPGTLELEAEPLALVLWFRSEPEKGDEAAIVSLWP